MTESWYYPLRYPLPLTPTMLKLVECLALIDAGYIGTRDRLWTRHD